MDVKSFVSCFHPVTRSLFISLSETDSAEADKSDSDQGEKYFTDTDVSIDTSGW